MAEPFISIYVNCEDCHKNKENPCVNWAYGCCNYKLYEPESKEKENNASKNI